MQTDYGRGALILARAIAARISSTSFVRASKRVISRAVTFFSNGISSTSNFQESIGLVLTMLTGLRFTNLWHYRENPID